jgi:hypothetical protein
MKVTLNEALIKNIFVILDANGDNSIDLLEFETVFGKYLSTGGAAVKEVTSKDIENEFINEVAAKDLAK